MRILRLKTAVIEANFDWTFVRIETDEGILGLGECFFAPGLTAILRSLEPILVGQDPRDVHRIFRKLQLATSGAGSVAGIIYNALSGIEAALWDILGQWMDAPIYRLLGGKFRDEIRIYADCHGGEALESLDAVLRSRQPSWMEPTQAYTPQDYHDETGVEKPCSPEEYRKRAIQMKAQGYTALKFDIDVPGTYGTDAHNRCLTRAGIDQMVALIAAAREGAGNDVDIAVDCHWRYSVTDAIQIAHALEPFALLWMEDPVPPENVELLRSVSSRMRVPVATGENLYLFQGFRELLQSQAIAIATPDLQKVGGLGVASQIASFADAQTIPLAPHNISSPVGTLASAHFCAAIPNFLVLEFHGADVPFWESLVEGIPKPIIQNGKIRVPDRPGLGVRLNEEVARKYARKDEPFFE